MALRDQSACGLIFKQEANHNFSVLGDITVCSLSPVFFHHLREVIYKMYVFTFTGNVQKHHAICDSPLVDAEPIDFFRGKHAAQFL